MNCNVAYIPYNETGKFSKLVLDYIEGKDELKPFYENAFDLEGIKKSIDLKSSFNYRQELFSILSEQYKSVQTKDAVQQNIKKLLAENTFTVCTAHQPNLFTGPLYFIYKIAHAIQLANRLSKDFPLQQFVPVYYMGVEDADLEELGHIYASEKKYTWKTTQTGAVGRMVVDKNLTQLIDELEAQYSVNAFGKEIIQNLRNAYVEGITIQQATFNLVDSLFGKYGLVILLPDSPDFKKLFKPVILKELTEQFSRAEVEKTISAFPEKYSVQAAGRALNLFYLVDNIRERIVSENNGYSISNTNLFFSKEELWQQVEFHPERFSPNVILRPVFQEIILPNVAFIGGGGEISYWLELKNVFKKAEVPMPVLVLRNSFLFIQAKQHALISKWELNFIELFQPSSIILKQLIGQQTTHQLSLDDPKEQLEKVYEIISESVSKIDTGLQQHVAALKHLAIEKIKKVEKKMYRAEKKKFEAMERQFNKLYQQLFPDANLQEREQNLIEYYAVYGSDFIDMIVHNSENPSQEFCIISEIKTT